jgi:hypothetical protein
VREEQLMAARDGRGDATARGGMESQERAHARRSMRRKRGRGRSKQVVDNG